MNKSNIFVFLVLTQFLFSCETARQVDKALYGVANKVSSRDLVTGQRNLNTATRAQQIKQGNQSALQIIEKYQQSGKPLNEQINKNQYQRLVNIVQNIIAVSHLKGENWQIVMLPEKEYNAFVTGGTIVFVNYGLMQSSPFDDEVAAVVGHEIAHVAASHISERQASQMAASLAGSKSAKSDLVKAAFSQNDELEADKIGILYMVLAGYEPEASERIWQKIYNQSGNNGQMITSHPISSDRMVRNRETIARAKKYFIAGQPNPNYEYILKNNDITGGSSLGNALASLTSGMQNQNIAQNNNSTATSAEPMAGAGAVAVAETFLNYYQGKKQAKKQAASEVNRVTSLKEIQSNMQIVGGRKNDDGSFSMDVKYTGSVPVQNLAIKAMTSSTEAIYRHPGIIVPQQSFSATFGQELLDNAGEKPKMKLLVDEGLYVN